MAQRRLPPLRLGIEAVKTDDVSLMSAVIAQASEPDSRQKAAEVMQRSLARACSRHALKVLRYLLDEQGADVHTIHPRNLFHAEGTGPSTEVLKILLQHGWDINSRQDRTDAPLLWRVTGDYELTKWCLDHGASVHVPGDTPSPPSGSGAGPVPRTPLLECAARSGNVQTFELLRSAGAKMTPAVLCRACDAAALYVPSPANTTSIDMDLHNSAREERMAVVRYLVSTLHLDVNAEGRWAGSSCTTPLCHVADRSNRGDKDARELIWFLMDSGADPKLKGSKAELGDGLGLSAVECAEMMGNEGFLAAVREWEERKKGGSEGAPLNRAVTCISTDLYVCKRYSCLSPNSTSSENDDNDVRGVEGLVTVLLHGGSIRLSELLSKV
ncbi:Uu.00g047530.m01.CDS01 [Anthostomella pinea]|uniref:Uu.00g047530.m01.CDS01 n=1 Tax=Anthostomella pinea TaxID=933095 RepID=A0AAI8YEL1_9PEZI|nr:Uu.00g047530.m01.CDS01 [Anthostomella pinea]